MNLEKDLFAIFQQSKTNDYDFYLKIINYIKEYENHILGVENSGFYAKLSELTNSINNAGHEERRSDDISKISDWQGKIIDNYEDFLP